MITFHCLPLPLIHPLYLKLISLKTGKSPGPDGWSAEVFKQCADQLCVPLSILFTKSLESGSLPEDWKSCHITPIYKGVARLR